MMQIAAAVLIAAAGLAPMQPAGDAALVVTDKGSVRGGATADYRQFKGIPFAAPPKGELRWRAPQPVTPWATPRDATKPGSQCAQGGGFGGGSENEDCLYLNVTTPKHGRKLPVLVWIHGGAFAFGDGSGYGPQEMAARGDVVVVTINYRLGAFGFLAHPALGQSGNFGLQDQQAALRWVHRNAEAFGGDAGNVTIFGESSGGRSVCTHMVSSAAIGLFHRAIIQSEPCTQTEWPQANGGLDPNPPGFPRSKAAAEQQGVAVAGKLGCTTAACLRAAPAAEVLKQTAQDWFAPTHGTSVLPLDPARAFAIGAFAKVPVMHGITRDEYRIADAFGELFEQTSPLTEEGYVARVTAFVGAAKAAQVLDRYPLRDFGSPSEAWAAVVTDRIFARPATDLNRDLARRVATYAYEFADRQAPWMFGIGTPSFPTGAYHTSELQYLFAAAGMPGPRTEAQKALSGKMIDYWTQFARTGDPNGPGLPAWPRADQNAGVAQEFADGVRTVAFTARHNHDFWRTF